MQETINVRIKMFPGNPPRPSTTKVFLDKRALGPNARPLEPGEIVAMPKLMAEEMLRHLPYELEMTMEDANRPLAFENQHQASMTSTQNTMIRRSEQIKAAHEAEVAKVREEMKKRNDLIAREEEIARREAELGIGQSEPEPASPPKFTIDDEDVREPRHNAMTRDELDELRKDADEQMEKTRAEAEQKMQEARAPVKRKRGRPPKNPQPETAA